MKYFKHIFPLFLFILTACDNTNWNESYWKNSESPFGTYIIYEELENIFPNSKVESLKQHVYDELTYLSYENNDNNVTNSSRINYICIKNKTNKFDSDGINKLIDFVAKGNNAFLSLNKFSEILANSLEIETSEEKNLNLKESGGYFYLKNKKLHPKKYFYKRNIHKNYFSKFNENNTVVLGTEKINNINKPIFLKVYYGKGAFFLHSEPIAFTNYYMLKKDNLAYVSNVLSYMKDAEKIWWDTQMHYKNNETEEEKDSVLRFFWENPSLKWSMLVAFFGLIGFMIFNARRKQRPIPEIKKLKNSTVEFTHTIANLYLVENNPQNLVNKKITYFLQYIRTNYMLDTNHLNERFVERLATKSGNTIKITKYLINYITILYNRTACTKDELLHLNTLIENFLNSENKS